MLAESLSMGSKRSCVAEVESTLPLKPLLTSLGSMPEWSIWAWVTNTKSISAGLKGRVLSSSPSEPSPWCMPHSTSILSLFVSM